MSYDEPPFGEPFGADYETPPPSGCPNCACCTARLCEKATEGGVRCVVHVWGEVVVTVKDCPCTISLVRGGPELLETAYFKELQARRSE